MEQKIIEIVRGTKKQGELLKAGWRYLTCDEVREGPCVIREDVLAVINGDNDDTKYRLKDGEMYGKTTQNIIDGSSLTQYYVVEGSFDEEMEFSLMSRCRRLGVTILRGKNLKKMDIFGSSDPFVTISSVGKKSFFDMLDHGYMRTDISKIKTDQDMEKDTEIIPEQNKTTVKRKTLNPEWNEVFNLNVNTTEEVLVLDVFDWNRIRSDKFIGRAIILYSIIEARMNLKNEDSLEFELTRIPEKTESWCDTSYLKDNFGKLYVRFHFSDISGVEINDETEELPNETINSLFHPDTNLPDDWEERTAHNGRTFYVNHSTNSTQWERPIIGPVTLESHTSQDGRFQMRRLISKDVEIEDSQDYKDAEIKDLQEHPPLDVVGNMMIQAMESKKKIEDDQSEVVPSNTPSAPPLEGVNENNEDGDQNQSGNIGGAAGGQGVSNPSRYVHPMVQNYANVLGWDENPERDELMTKLMQGIGGIRAKNNPVGPHGRRMAQVTPDLPAGWTQGRDPDGRIFYTNHRERRSSWTDPRVATAPPSEEDLGPLPEGWEEKCTPDGRTFYLNHATESSTWEDPRKALKTGTSKIIYSRDYKAKYEAFISRQMANAASIDNIKTSDKLVLKVHRDSVFMDSFEEIKKLENVKVKASTELDDWFATTSADFIEIFKPPQHDPKEWAKMFPKGGKTSTQSQIHLLKARMWVEFIGETGLDYGGLAREWFSLMSQSMLSPYHGLFEYSANDNYTLQINPQSEACDPNHLEHFKFIGRVAGMAVFHRKLLDGFFIRPFYKMMLKKQITLADMEAVDAEYYKSLIWIKDNDPSVLAMTFSVDVQIFGKTEEKELVPGGSQIDVTEENKDEYIKKMIEWRFVSRIKEQMDNFMEGFNDVIPLDNIQIFDEYELELLLSGIGFIDADDWMINTVCKGYSSNDEVIQWFWKVVVSFGNEQRSRLLQFVTGTSRVPMNGFKELYGSNGPQLFTIEKWGTPDSLPRAHTCFNRIDLPPYRTFSDLKEKLIMAVEGSAGFEGVD